MPLRTARELEAARSRAPDAAPEAPAAPAPKADRAAPGPRVRMYHPDSAPGNLPTCEFELDGEAVRLERGAAVVTAATASKLEASGWRRGREVKE